MRAIFDCERYLSEHDALVCPSCADTYVHPMLDSVEVHKIDDYSCPLGTRGDWLAVPFSCERCSGVPGDPDGLLDLTREVFRLIVGFHKGTTFVGVVLTHEEVAA